MSIENTVLLKSVKDGIDKIVEEEIDIAMNQANIKIRERVSLEISAVSLRVMESIRFETMGRELIIRVELPKDKLK